MILREFLTKFGVEADHKELAKWDRAVDGAKKGLLALTAAGAGAAYGLSRLVRSVADTGDAIDKKSQAAMLSAESYQELSHAAELSGTSIGVLSSAMQRLSGTMGQAEQGGKAAQGMFDQLGISIKDSNGQLKTGEVMLSEVADGLNGITDTATRARIAQQLFGRGMAGQLTPLMNAGSEGIAAMRQEVHDLGGMMGANTIKAAADYQDSMARIRLASNGLKYTLAGALLPAVNDLLAKYTEWSSANREVIHERLEKWGKRVARIMTWLGNNIRFVTITLGVFAGAFAAIKLGAKLVTLMAMVKSAGGLAVVFKAIGAILLKFVAPIALLAVLALVLEDIYVGATGGESALGELYDKLIESDTWYGQVARDLTEIHEKLVEDMSRGIEHVVNGVKELISWYKRAGDEADAFFNWFDKHATRLANIIPGVNLVSIEESRGGLPTLTSRGQGGSVVVAQATPQMAAEAAAMRQQQAPNLTVNTQVDAGNATAEEVGPIVEQATRKAIENTYYPAFLNYATREE